MFFQIFATKHGSMPTVTCDGGCQFREWLCHQNLKPQTWKLEPQIFADKYCHTFGTATGLHCIYHKEWKVLGVNLPLPNPFFDMLAKAGMALDIK
jgi:hypothetical protein